MTIDAGADLMTKYQVVQRRNIPRNTVPYGVTSRAHVTQPMRQRSQDAASAALNAALAFDRLPMDGVIPLDAVDAYAEALTMLELAKHLQPLVQAWCCVRKSEDRKVCHSAHFTEAEAGQWIPFWKASRRFGLQAGEVFLVELAPVTIALLRRPNTPPPSQPWPAWVDTVGIDPLD